MKLPRVKTVRSGRRPRYYYNTGQKRPNGAVIYVRLPDPTSPDFMARYAALQAARTRRATVADRAVEAVAERYYRSPTFDTLATGTQMHYRRHIDIIVEYFRGTPVDRIRRDELQRLCDHIGRERPGTASSIVGAGRAFFRWCIRRGYVEQTPLHDIELVDGGEWLPWPPELLAAALQSPIAPYVALLYYTGQRIGDAARITWRHIDAGRIELAQQKTGKAVSIPVHPELRRHLPARGHVTVWGMGASAVRKRIGAWLRENSAGRYVPHGLRKNAVGALLDAGCSHAEVSSITGQSVAMVTHYDRHNRQAARADAAILKWTRG